MSGYKRATITINQDEYNRLQDADRRLRALPDPSDAVFREIAQQSAQIAQANLQALQQRQAGFERVITGLNAQIRGLETAANQAFMDYERSTARAVQNAAGCLWDHYDQVIGEQARYYEAARAADHAQYQQALEQYAASVQAVWDDQARKQAAAVDWLEAAGALAEFIQLNYDHQAAAPGQVDQLNNRLDQARQNLSAGLYEAAVAAGQQAFLDFSDLRLELERWHNEWNLLLQAAWEACQQVLTLGENSAEVQAIDLDGNLLPYAIMTDAWSEGRYTQWLASISDLRRQFDAGDQLPGPAELRRWLAVDLPDYYQSLQAIVLDARVNALNSQLRINIADLVVRALREQGFNLETSAYEASDMRNAYQARLANLDGSEVVVQVAPTGSTLGANELRLNSLDGEQRTEHELSRRWQEVSQSLSHYGIEVGPYLREERAPYAVSTGQAGRGRSIAQYFGRRSKEKHGHRAHPSGLSPE